MKANDPSPSDAPMDPRLEHMYRRGYVHGVMAIIAALKGRLPKEEARNLEAWTEETLFKWSTSDLELARRPPEVPAGG
jgi:hypothetical protein